MLIMEQARGEELMPEDFVGFAITLWNIWTHKNKVLFEDAMQNTTTVLRSTYKVLFEVVTPNTTTMLSQHWN